MSEFNIQNITKDFGFKSSLAKKGIQTFYNIFCNNINDANKGNLLETFRKWRWIFEACGYNISIFDKKESLTHSFKKEVRKFAIEYGIELFPRIPELLFSIQTYYTIFLKLLTVEILVFYGYSFKKSQSIHETRYMKKKSRIRDYITILENSDVIQVLNLNPYLNRIYSWYLDIWDNSIEVIIYEMRNKISNYNLETLSNGFLNSKDLFKQLYQSLIPKKIRHGLGEFYTPDWLAEHVLEELGYTGNPEASILDPSCGSGTFLIMSIKQIKKWVKLNKLESDLTNVSLLAKILKNIVGFDLNPLAVMSASINYLISLLDLNIQDKKINIPVYLCDPIASETDHWNEWELKPPILHHKFDYVIGNPPWINWKTLPKNYRNSLKPLMIRYDLFSLKRCESQYGGSEKDIALLFIYISLDKYLKKNGRISYVITQSIYQTKGAADGFRKFSFRSLEGEDHNFRIIKVVDLVDISPFKDVSNRTSTLIIENNRENSFPVPYYVWRRRNKKSIPQSSSYDDVRKCVLIEEKRARPIGEISSPWVILDKKLESSFQNITGKSSYSAIAGSCTWLDSVYSLKILKKIDEEKIQIHNNITAGRIEVPRVQAVIEKDLVFVSARGRDINRWKWNDSENYILIPQDPHKRHGYDEKFMAKKFPLTYQYLLKFKEKLIKRSGYLKYHERKASPFYSMYNISTSSFMPYKVAWRYISKKFNSCVIKPKKDKLLGEKPVIPNNKIMFVPLEREEEAHYLCGMLNSSYFRELIESFTISTQVSTYILDYLRIPTFDSKNRNHKKMTQLSQICHQLAEKDPDINASKIMENENKIDILFEQILLEQN